MLRFQTQKDCCVRAASTGKVRIGQRFTTEALIVPQEATFEIQDKVFVFALGDSNKVITKPILISGRNGTIIISLDSGVEAGEKIVLSGREACRMGWQFIRSLYQ